jgi:hypothetical protein
MTLQFERKYSTQDSGASCHVSFVYFSNFFGIRLVELQIDRQLVLGSLIPAGRRKITCEAKEPPLPPPSLFLLYREEVGLYIISTDEVLNYKIGP